MRFLSLFLVFPLLASERKNRVRHQDEIGW